MRCASLAILFMLAIVAPRSAHATLATYQASVQNESSLLGYYTFDTAVNGGTVADLSGNGYTGSTYQVDGVNGSFVAGAPDGSSSGQYYDNITNNTSVYGQPVTTPGWPAAGNGTPFSFADGNGTVSFWFTHDGASGNRLAAGIRVSVPGTRYSIHINGPSDTVGVWNSAAFETRPTGAIDVDDGNWHHLAVVFESASSVRYVLDGTDLGTTSNGPQNADGNIQELGIGATPDTSGTGEAWLGNLDEVAFFEDALSVSAIQTQYNAMTVPEPSGLVILLSLVACGLAGYGLRRGR